MDILERLDILAECARRETPPATNVCVRLILQDGAREYASRNRYKPLAWSAAAAAAAACVTLVLSLRGSPAPTDPVSSLFTPLQVEMP